MFILINGFNSTNPNSSSVSFCLRSRTLTLRHHEENSGALNTAAVTQGQSPQHIWTLCTIKYSVLRNILVTQGHFMKYCSFIIVDQTNAVSNESREILLNYRKCQYFSLKKCFFISCCLIILQTKWTVLSGDVAETLSSTLLPSSGHYGEVHCQLERIAPKEKPKRQTYLD